MIRISLLVGSWLCVIALTGCNTAEFESFGGVSGSVSVDSKPAPAGTRIRFRHRDDPASEFFTMVDDQGGYSYQPPSEAPFRAGEYEIAVDPISSTTATDDTGLSVSVVVPGAPKTYGKFSQLSQSGLAATLNSGNVVYDIQLTSR